MQGDLSTRKKQLSIPTNGKVGKQRRKKRNRVEIAPSESKEATQRRLEILEAEIREGLLEEGEGFYRVGMRLTEIRKNKLWKTAGFKSWRNYVDTKLDMKRRNADYHIKAAEYRKIITTGNNLPGWSYLACVELTRVPLEHAKEIAKRVESEAGKQRKTVTSEFVRSIVSAYLKRPTRPKREKLPKLGEGNVHVWLNRYAADIQAWRENLEENIPQDGWVLLNQDYQAFIKRLITACDRLAGFLREKLQ